MRVGIHSHGEVRQRLRAALASHEWWIIPWIGPSASQLSEMVEAAAYTGDAGVDFEIFLMPGTIPGVFAVAIARKHRLPASQLAAVLTQAGSPITAAMLETNDVLLAEPGDPEARDFIAASAFALGLWMDLPPEEDAAVPE